MKDETGAAIKELVGSKPKMMMPFYVKDNSEHKKRKDVNRNVVTRKTHNKY